MVNKIHFNKSVKLDKNVSWLIGFYLAEGVKSKNTIGIANKEVILINKALSIFHKYFSIDKKLWKVFIKTNSRDKDEIMSITNYWERKLNMKARPSYAPFAYEQTIDIRINSRELSKFLNNYFTDSIDKILSDKNLAKAFLRGYAIGDGSIGMRGKQIHNIGITVKNEEYLGYLSKAFTLIYNRKPNIRRNKDCYEVYYCHVNTITKIILSKLFIDLNRQWKKLIRGYKNKQYTRARIKYWDKIKNNPLPAQKISELSGNSHWSVRDALNKDIKLGLVGFQLVPNLSGRGPPNKCYYLTQEGLSLAHSLEI